MAKAKRELARLLTKRCRYTWSKGARYGPETAAKVGELLEEMDARGIPLTPENLLHMAEPEDSPIHALFEWDNEVAAHEYRLSQARNIVNHLYIIEETEQGERTEKAFFSLRLETSHPDNETTIPLHNEYLPVSHVKSDQYLREQTLKNAMRELRTWAKKYDTFDFPELEPFIREVLGK